MMFRIMYRVAGSLRPFHTIAESYRESIENFIETTGRSEKEIQSITLLD